MKNYLLSLLVFLSTLLSAQVSIGSGSSGSGFNSYPIAGYYGSSYSQSIYLASEINATGDISSIQYLVNTGSTFEDSDDSLYVWIGHTTKTSFSSTSDWVDVADLTQVLVDGTAILSSDTLTITLSTPFTYNGTDNLLIAIDANETGFDPSSNYVLTTAILNGDNVTIHQQSDGTNADPLGTLPNGTNSSSRGNIILNGITQSCLPPSNMSSSNIATTSADLSWLASSSNETAWNIEYFTSNFTPGSSATGVLSEAVSGSPEASLTGLNSGTTYYVYYQADCSGGETSTWVGPIELVTLCDVITTFPWTENFESTTAPALVNCWSQLNNNEDADSFVTYSSYGVSGSLAAGIRTDFNGGANDDYLILPQFSLTGNQRIKFSTRARSSGEPNDYRVVLSTTGTDAADFSTEILPLQTVNFTTQTEITPIDLSAYSGNVYIAIHIPNGGLDGYFIYFDEFTVEDIPSCVVPSSMLANNISTTSAVLDWTAGSSGESAWNVEYHTEDFTPGTSAADVVISNVAGAPTTNLSGLTANTSYFVYYQADCTGGDVSAWVGPFEFNTSCESVSTFPWTEDFESISTPDVPECWNVINNNNDADEFVTYTTYGVSSSKTVGIKTDFNSGNNDDYLVLPRFTLTSNQRLKFFTRARSTGEPNDFRVVLSTTGINPADFTTELLPLQTVNYTTQTEISPIDLSAYSGDVYIAIHIPNGGLDGYYIYFDDFTLEDIPTCTVPSAMNVSNILPTSVDLEWTVGGSGESAWNIEYFTADFTPGTSATGVLTSNVSGTPASNLTGLAANTTYFVYYQADCTGGDVSAWVGPFEFTTECEAISAPIVVDMSNNPPTSCWAEAGSGLPSVGPSGTSSDWKDGRSYTKTDGSVVASNSINLFSNSDQEWLISQVIDPTVGDDKKMILELALTNYKFSGVSTATDTDNMGSDDEVRLLITRNGGVTWDSITSWTLANQPLVTGTTYEFDMTSETTLVQFALWASDGSVNDSEDYDILVGRFDIEDITCYNVTYDHNYNGCVGDGYSETINSTVYDASNPTGVETITLPNGCDSIVTVNLTFATPSANTIIETSCSGSIDINGETYTSTGVYTQTLSNFVGCDSVLTIELTIQEDITPVLTVINGVFITNQTNGTFEWFLCGSTTPIAGETSNNFTPTDNGEYYLTVTFNGCTYNSDCLEINTIGVNEYGEKVNFDVYPNPNNGQFEITWDSKEYTELRVINTLGMSLLHSNIDVNTFNKSVNINVESGVYYVQMLSNNKTWETKQLIIK